MADCSLIQHTHSSRGERLFAPTLFIFSKAKLTLTVRLFCPLIENYESKWLKALLYLILISSRKSFFFISVGTTEAASLLGISPRRLRQLLGEHRVRGARKSGSIWIIPLFNGVPVIIKGQRGPQGTWRKKRQQALTRLNVSSHSPETKI